jgi:transposase
VPLVDAVAVPRPGGRGRHRKRLDHLIADKAYGSKANRRSLRARGIAHTIPERDDVRASRARKGSRGGRPPNFNATRYKDRNQVERAFTRLKQFRAVATRYDKLKRPLPRNGYHRLDHGMASRETRPTTLMIRQIRPRLQAIQLSPYRAGPSAHRPVRLGTAADFLACSCPV